MKKFFAIIFMLIFTFGAASVKTCAAELTPREQIIKQIIEKHYNYDSTGLLKALKDGNTDCVNLFIESGFNPNMTIMKMPLIYWAIKFKKPDIVEKLLAAGVNPNQEVSGKTLMAHAIATQNTETVKSLIKHGAKVNDMSAGKSLLTLALSKKSAEISELLVKAGANVDEAAFKKAQKINDSTLKAIITANYQDNR